MTGRALHTDLYQLTMMAGYLAGGVHRQPATFELFIRRLPPHRAYVVSAGLDTVLQFIESQSFSNRDVEWVRAIPAFRHAPVLGDDTRAPDRHTESFYDVHAVMRLPILIALGAAACSSAPGPKWNGVIGTVQTPSVYCGTPSSMCHQFALDPV